MLSIVAGHDVNYLTGPVAGGREGYYTAATAAGEPPGLWYGAGAEALGLRGEVDADLIEAIYMHLRDPRDPAAHNRATWDNAAALGNGHRKYRSAEDILKEALAGEPHATPERRAEMQRQAELGARQPVAFFDATFSAPKSVSVLGAAFERAENEARAAGDHAAADAWGVARQAVEDAVLAGSRASLDHLAAAAGYSRVGKHGTGSTGRWIDTNGLVIAQFLQHDSRDRDPQLHVHAAILNRVECADGQWRTIDGALLFQERGAAGAIGERVMEAWLIRTLGVTFAMRPDGKAREIVGIPQAVMDLFSSRRHAVTAKSAEITRAFVARHGREPSALERTRIAQQATLATRAAKSHDGETTAQRLDRWERECRKLVDDGLASVARGVVSLHGQPRPAAEQWSPTAVVEQALAAVAGTKQTWTRSDLTRAISNALPGVLGLDPDRIPELLGRLTDQALQSAVAVTPASDMANQPAEFRLRGGGDCFR